MENEIVYLYLDDIIPNRFQPREVFDDKALKELAVSIREHGVIQPIIVRKIGTKYEIIAGERRYKASTMVGLTKIPAIIRNLDDKESSKVALIENLQRKDLTAIEEARTYQKILDIDNMTQEELAKTMGKSQSAISNKLRLLTLSNKIQDALLNEKISERHARTLLNVESEEERDRLTDLIIEKRLSVKDLENLIKEEKKAKNEEVSLTEDQDQKEGKIIDEKKIEPDDVNNNGGNNYPRIKLDDLLKDIIKEDDEKPPEENSSEIEMLDLSESDDNYYSFKGLKEVANASNSIEKCINMIRDTVKEIENKGYQVKFDELDLENKHRFIIEIEKKGE